MTYPILLEQMLMKLGARISLARRARGVTRKELAFQTGLSVGTLAALEAGQPGVSVGAFLKVLDVLNLLEEIDLLLRPENDPIVIARGVSRITTRAS